MAACAASYVVVSEFESDRESIHTAACLSRARDDERLVRKLRDVQLIQLGWWRLLCSGVLRELVVNQNTKSATGRSIVARETGS